MPSLPTLPKKPWQSHVTVALALAVLVLGSASLFGLLDWLDLIFPSTLHNAGWYQVLGGCVALLGLGVLLGELTSRTNSAGPALVVIGVGLAELAANLTGNDSVLDAWFVQHTFGGGATLSESMPPYAIYALLLAGAPVLWFALPVSRATRSPALALAGSLLAAVGFATFAGHLLNELASQGQNQPAAGSWGLTASLPPSVTLAVLVLGAMLLALAAREHARDRADAPAWLPLPFVTGAAALTLVFWAGLRERELYYLPAVCRRNGRARR